MTEKTYLKRFFCTNCQTWFDKIFPFGQRAIQGDCPNCGVSERSTQIPDYMFRNINKKLSAEEVLL